MQEPRIEGHFLSVPVASNSPAVFGRLASMEIQDGYELDAVEAADVTVPGSCLIVLPDGSRHVANISEGRIIGPATLLQIDGLWPGEAAIDAEMIATEQHRLAGAKPHRRAGYGIIRPLLTIACGLMALASGIALTTMDLTEEQLFVVLGLGALNFGLCGYFSGIISPEGAVPAETA